MFGSLYLDEVTLDPRDIISTLATATLFQLDGLIERCAEVMNESMNAEVRRANIKTGKYRNWANVSV